jgi:ATP-dependent protease ClpP protease subunit
MKLNFFSKIYSALGRMVTDLENEACYNETQETSEPVFWLVFGIAISIAVIFLYVATPMRRLIRLFS